MRREAETLGCVPGRRYVVCPTPQGTVPTSTLLDNIVDRAATLGASRIYLAHAGGAGFEDEPSTLLASLEERGFDARTASTGIEALDPFDVSLVEQELCERAAAFVGTADSTWTSLVAHRRFARGENCSTSFEQLLSRQPRLNLNMPQGLVARELLARGVEDFRRRCV